MCSSILEITTVSETGRYFSGLDLFPFLKIGTTFACFQSRGISPVDKDC